MSDTSDPSTSLLSIRIKAILFFLAIAAAVAAGYAYRQHHLYKHVAVHDSGKMYRSSWVDPDVMAELIDKHQIRTVVNLCEPGETGEHRWALERETVREAGARLLELPMPTTDDPQDENLRLHLAALSDSENYPMLVHCQHGVTRTSKFLAIYDIFIRGKSADESLDALPLFGRDAHDGKLTAFCRSFENCRTQFVPEATASRGGAVVH